MLRGGELDMLARDEHHDRFHLPHWALSAMKEGRAVSEIGALLPPLPEIDSSRLAIKAGAPESEMRMGASPQLQNGYTKIADEILEALARVKISGHGWRILMVVFRKTYGWDKKLDWIAYEQFIEKTGLKKQRVYEAFKDLCERNILTRSGAKVGFQKDYTKWKNISQKGKSRKTVTVTEKRYSAVGSNGKPDSSNGKPGPQYTLIQQTKECVSPEDGSTLPDIDREKTESKGKPDISLRLDGTEPVNLAPAHAQSLILSGSETDANPTKAGRTHQVTGPERQRRQKTRTPKKPTEQGDPQYSDKFLLFWTAYPAREDGRKGSKQEAAAAFNGLNIEEQDNAILAARNFAATKPRFGIKDAVRFIVSGTGKNKIHIYKEHVNPERQESQSSMVPGYKRQYA